MKPTRQIGRWDDDPATRPAGSLSSPSMSQMKPYCFKCGAELEPEAIRCPHCGSPDTRG